MINVWFRVSLPGVGPILWPLWCRQAYAAEWAGGGGGGAVHKDSYHFRLDVAHWMVTKVEGGKRMPKSC